METIKERILREGRSGEGGILKVDGIMSHQVDTNFIMDVAKEFVSDEYTIRQMNEEDIKELKKDDNYYEIALDFAVAVIERYKEYYTVS